jgi:hypothetical protein
MKDILYSLANALLVGLSGMPPSPLTGWMLDRPTSDRKNCIYRSPKGASGVDSGSNTKMTLEGDEKGRNREALESPKTTPLRRPSVTLRNNQSIRPRAGGGLHEKSSFQHPAVERSSLDCPSYLFAPPSTSEPRPPERTRTRTSIHQQKSAFLSSFRDTVPLNETTTVGEEPPTASAATKTTFLRASSAARWPRARRDEPPTEGAVTAVALASIPTTPRRLRRRSTGTAETTPSSPPPRPSPTNGRRTAVRLRAKGQRTTSSPGKPLPPVSPVPDAARRQVVAVTSELPLAALQW